MDRYICGICGRQFALQRALTLHRRALHQAEYDTPLETNSPISFDPDHEMVSDNERENDSNPLLPQTTRANPFPNAGRPIGNTICQAPHQHGDWNPLEPFSTLAQWNLFRSMVESNIGKNTIDRLIRRNLFVPEIDTPNAGILRGIVERMETGYPDWNEASIEIQKQPTPYWYRDPIWAVNYILGHTPFESFLRYAPEKEYDENGERIYAEMWSGNWWSRMQVS
jgi:hypothetical protein